MDDGKGRKPGEDDLIAANQRSFGEADELAEGSARWALLERDLIVARGGVPRAWLSEGNVYHVEEVAA